MERSEICEWNDTAPASFGGVSPTLVVLVKYQVVDVEESIYTPGDYQLDSPDRNMRPITTND